jgi:hypothetical protein
LSLKAEKNWHQKSGANRREPKSCPTMTTSGEESK